MSADHVASTDAARAASPSPSISPTPALGACPELSRCLSTASSTSNVSARSCSMPLDPGDGAARQSSGSYGSRQSSGSYDRQNRRGFVRPQGTNFAASAQSRDSVLSLGSITHIQYYFSRTGLLDGKGGQLARKKNARGGTLDLSSLDASFLPAGEAADRDSSYASSMGSPVFFTQEPASYTETEDYYSDEEPDLPDMLPPTTSTYNPRQKPLPHPPSLDELKDELLSSIGVAQQALVEIRDAQDADTPPPPPPKNGQSEGWFQVQGMHIIDVMTLAIRAAKMYYTAHDKPARLAMIKPEREIRAELLAVMEVLRKMATRQFHGGMRADEIHVLHKWTASVRDMLRQEEVHEAEERRKRRSWVWLDDSAWEGPLELREYHFLQTMDPHSDTLPPWTPAADAAELPTPFLRSLHDGQRLIQMHNAAVRESRKKYGSVTAFHADTKKPYRLADNLRYWIKAAELRWELLLRVDVMGLATEGTSRQVWLDFEAAVWTWARGVRSELAFDIKGQ